MKKVPHCKRHNGKPGNIRNIWNDKETALLAEFYGLPSDPAAFGCKRRQKIKWVDVMWIVENMWSCYFDGLLSQPIIHFDVPIPYSLIQTHLEHTDFVSRVGSPHIKDITTLIFIELQKITGPNN